MANTKATDNGAAPLNLSIIQLDGFEFTRTGKTAEPNPVQTMFDAGHKTMGKSFGITGVKSDEQALLVVKYLRRAANAVTPPVSVKTQYVPAKGAVAFAVVDKISRPRKPKAETSPT